MRVVVFVVAILVMATTSEASSACMNKTEARKHFGSTHIYWHGADHCWDATSTRQHHHFVRQAERKADRPKAQDLRNQDGKSQVFQRQEARRQDAEPRDAVRQAFDQKLAESQAPEPQAFKPQASGSQASGSQASGSQALQRQASVLPLAIAEVRPVRMPAPRSWSDRWVDIQPTQLPLAERWVDIAPIAPSLSKSAPDPELRMMVLGLVLVVVALMLAIIEVLFRAASGARDTDQAVA
jgi:hypothetical protein